uniref:GTP-binding protein n=1 Tax=viral metagenome TaxID=1070528 RepID=A0A6C0CH34_9ZZZZ
MEPVYIFKVVLLGDPMVGKSAFIKRCTSGSFNSNYVKRVGVDFTSKTVQLPDGKQAHIHFWDILGSSRVIDQPSIYFRNTHGAIVMYDSNEPNGKAHVAEWKTLLETYATLDGKPCNPPTILVANKLDLVCKKSDEYDREELMATTDTLGFVAGYPCSVAANWNVDPIIRTLINRMIETQPIANLEKEVTLFEDNGNPEEKPGCIVQ